MLEVVPLGGLGEFGMNMLSLNWGETTIVVDAGVMFPDPDLLGVDRIIWGGDFPHYPTRWPESRQLLARQMEGIPGEERRQMLAQNLIDFLHLDAVAETPNL